MPDVEDRPEIAVVTVALNAARDLPLTLESVLAQSYDRLRLIVADGASWDDSDAVLRRYASGIDRLIVRPDAGIYQAMNDILDDVTSDYVLFLNAGDQFWSADAVARMVAELDGRPDIFYGNHIYVDRRRELFKRSADFDWLAERLERGAIDHAWHSAIPGHQATFARTALLRRLRFDTRLKIGADHELLFRAHASGARMQYIDECVAHYHGGGFSALAGERTLVEGVSVYRRFSQQPHKVDALFFPEGSPFGSQTEMTGFHLSGFTRLDTGPDASGLAAETCWVAAGGASIVAPSRQVDGIVLRGWNALAEQGADLFCDGEKLASIAIPAASFRLNLAFRRPLEPREIVDVVPWRKTATSTGEEAGFALQSFQFLSRHSPPDLILPRGTEIAFTAEAQTYTQELMGSGWSAAESTHSWSLGTLSDLWLPVAADVHGVTLALSGNPHVPDSAQRVTFRINGIAVEEVVFADGERREVTLRCDHPAWQRGGNNNLVFELHASAVPPADCNDARDLGICLWKLDVE